MNNAKATKPSEGFPEYNNATLRENNSAANQTNLCKENAEAANEQNSYNYKTDESRGKQIMTNENNTNSAVAYIMDSRSNIGSKQMAVIEKHADTHNMKIEQTYIDYAGGFNATRPRFQQLKKDIESGKVTSKTILVHTIVKINSDIVTLMDELEWCEKNGVRIISVADGTNMAARYNLFPYILGLASMC